MRAAIVMGNCGTIQFRSPASALEVQRALGLTATGDWAPFPEAPPRGPRGHDKPTPEAGPPEAAAREG